MVLGFPRCFYLCWQLAETAGHASSQWMQALLAEHAWDWTAALAVLQ
jgi:hypothetical protein